MEEQIISAIQIAWDPTPTADQFLKRQAFDYVNQLRQAPQAWHPCLNIFTHIPRHSEVVRVFSLEIVNNAVQGGLVDAQGLQLVKDQLMAYLQQAYGAGGNESVPDSAPIENKIAQTITYLFSAFYAGEWTSCITDLLALTKSANGMGDNLLGTVFYLRVINAIHDEIGDQLLSRSREEQDRANALKDLVRTRDVQRVAASWQEFLSSSAIQNPTVAELCLRSIGKWVSWIDISLVVNEQMLQRLFQQLQLAQNTSLSDSQRGARDAAVDVFTEIISKKMPAAQKVEMIAFLNVEDVMSQLVQCPALTSAGSSSYDSDFAEVVAKLVNVVVLDVVRVLESEQQSTEAWQKAERMLQSFLPHLLRFFSDEYDEVCSNVLGAMTDVLAFLRKATQGNEFSTQRAAMLTPMLSAIFAKMRYDDTSSWGDEEDKTDEAEFQELRKRLGALQAAIAAADEQLYMEAVTGLVTDTFQKLTTKGASINWRDLDLALHEMYLLGDLAVKSGGLYQKNKPNSPAAEHLIRMMLLMVQSNIGSYAHPAIQLQYMEICVRYASFFDQHGDYTRPTLECFLQLAHSDSQRVKNRSWYLLQRFIRHQRPHIASATEFVVQNLHGLLTVKAEVDQENNDDDMSSENDSGLDSVFVNQLYLFEAVGYVLSAPGVVADIQVHLLSTVMQPLIADVEKHIEAAKTGNEQSVTQIHHDIMAMGNVARGYYDWSGANPSVTGVDAPEPIREAFTRVSETTLIALTSLKSSFEIRTAARFTFSRLIGMIGRRMMQHLPQWVEGFLTESSSRDEMAQLLRLLDQVTYGFKLELFAFVDAMFTGLLQRVFSGISAEAVGTDDEIEQAELKREYLNFLLVILANDLAGVMVSTTNQPMLETVINTAEHFAKDIEDFPTAKMAFQVLNRMCYIWGGADVVQQQHTSQSHKENSFPPGTTETALAGFNHFMVRRFSPLCWAMPSNSAFNAKDAEARQVLQEAAALQKTIYAKTGDEYLTWLRNDELKGLVGMNEAMIEEFLKQFTTLDTKSWRQYFARFVSQGGHV